MKYALIDVGSNSIRLSVYEITGKDFKVLFREKQMARLASYVEDGLLVQDGIDRAVECLNEFHHTLQLLQIDQLSVFATASLRNITNTAEASAEISQRTGIPIEVISGTQEAEYGFRGVLHHADFKDGIFVDIGGASTEIVEFNNGAIVQAVSIPVGSLKLYRDCVKMILPGNGSRKRIDQAIERSLSNTIDPVPYPRMVCTGGTCRAVLRIIEKLYGAHNRTFTKAALNELYAKLCHNDKETADFILSHEPERINTLIPGLMVLHELCEAFSTEEITVSQYGVREGYLISRVLNPEN
ncbi:MAG: hypothetical protein ACI32N_09325 [Bulleidia sp.]